MLLLSAVVKAATYHPWRMREQLRREANRKDRHTVNMPSTALRKPPRKSPKRKRERETASREASAVVEVASSVSALESESHAFSAMRGADFLDTRCHSTKKRPRKARRSFGGARRRVFEIADHSGVRSWATRSRQHFRKGLPQSLLRFSA